MAQVRFSRILSLISEAGIAPLQHALEASYPVLSQDSTVGIMLRPDGVASQPQGETVWRFESSHDTWRVSVGAGFISSPRRAHHRHRPASGIITGLESWLSSPRQHADIAARLGGSVGSLTPADTIRLWDELADAWAALCVPSGSVQSVSATVVCADEMTVDESQSSQMLDLDFLSAAG